MHEDESKGRVVPGGVPPVAVLVTVVALVGIVTVCFTALAVTGSLDENTTPLLVTLLGVIVTAIPALLGAIYSERTARDIRNGVVTRKAADGAAAAIVQTIDPGHLRPDINPSDVMLPHQRPTGPQDPSTGGPV